MVSWSMGSQGGTVAPSTTPTIASSSGSHSVWERTGREAGAVIVWPRRCTLWGGPPKGQWYPARHEGSVGPHRRPDAPAAGHVRAAAQASGEEGCRRAAAGSHPAAQRSGAGSALLRPGAALVPPPARSPGDGLQPCDRDADPWTSGHAAADRGPERGGAAPRGLADGPP